MNFSEFSLLFTKRGERTAPSKPNSYAIICGNPHRAVLNYLWPVAPCRSIRDGKIRTATHRFKTSIPEMQKAAERQIAERPESAERRRKGLFGAGRPKNRCKARRLNWWLIGPVQAAPACTHLLPICERVQIVNMQHGYAIGLCNRPRRSARADTIQHGIACKALNWPYFAFLICFSISIAMQR